MKAGTAIYRKTLAGALAVLSDVDPRVLLKAGTVTTRDVEAVWMRWFSKSLVLRLGPPRRAQVVDRLNGLVDGAR
jgi:hypothetical protein